MSYNSKELLHLVFAEPGEVYYQESMLELNLEQYLWFQLRAAGYRKIFFLTRTDAPECFETRTFGDCGDDAFRAKRNPFSTPKNQFKKWLLSQLKEAAALVCPITDFCEVFAQGDWEDVLGELITAKRREGILVLTASDCAEETRDLFLKSPVFERRADGHCLCPGVWEIRKSVECGMYSELKNVMGEQCSFENIFDRRKIRGILTCLMGEMAVSGELCESFDVECMAEYLEFYMNSTAMRREEPLFEPGSLLENLSFRALYQLLRQREVMEELLDRVERIAAEGGVTEMLRSVYGRVKIPSSRIWRKDALIRKCIRLTLPRGIKNDQAEQQITEMRTLLQNPHNCPENSRIRGSMEKLLAELTQSEEERDYETAVRLIDLLNLCVRWIYVEANSRKEEAVCSMLEKMGTSYIALSRRYFKIHRLADTFAVKCDVNDESAAGRMNWNQFLQYQKESELLKDQLEKGEVVLRSLKANLQIKESEEQVKEASDNIKRFMEEMDTQKEAIERKAKNVDVTLPKGVEYRELVRKMRQL